MAFAARDLQTKRPPRPSTIEATSTIFHAYWRSHVPALNGGPTGDCNGLTAVLPVIRHMGFDSVWIAPFFRTPGGYSNGRYVSRSVDAGYDITDYFAVDPLFGTMKDVEKLIDTAAELGMKLLIDIVPSHTSNQHPFFREALRDPASPYRKWYVIQQSVDGPPSNACSVFATDPNPEGSAWARNPHRRDEWYLHQFNEEQPQLDGSNPEVQDYFVEVLKFWALKGFSGARVDALQYFAINPRIRTEDNPKVAPDHPRPYRRWRQHFSIDARGDGGENLSAQAFGRVIDLVHNEHPEMWFCHESNDLPGGSLVAYAAAGLDALDIIKSGPDVSLNFADRDIEALRRAMQRRHEDGRSGIRRIGFDGTHDRPATSTANPNWVGDPSKPNQGALRQIMTFLMTSPSGGPVIIYGVPLGNGIGTSNANDYSKVRDVTRFPIDWGIENLPSPTWLQARDGEGESVFHQLQDPTSYLNFVRSLMALRKNIDPDADLVFHRAWGGILDYSVGGVRVTANIGDRPEHIGDVCETHAVAYNQGVLGNTIAPQGLRIAYGPLLSLGPEIPQRSSEFTLMSGFS